MRSAAPSPGAPFVVLGQNRHVTWGETTTGFDVTDTYLEQLVPDVLARRAGCPSDSTWASSSPSSRFPVTFRANLRRRTGNGPTPIVPLPPGGAIPPVVLTLPRRNNGPCDCGPSAAGRYGDQRAVHGLQRHARARDVPAVQLRAQPRRLRARAAVLRRRLAELHLRRHRRQHRLLHHGRSAAARGPAGATRPDRRAALVHPQRRRAATSGCATRTPDAFNGTGYLSLPFEELPQTRQPEERLRRERQQRHLGRHARQRPAEPAAPRRRGHLLPRLRVRLRHARRPHHAGPAGAPRARARWTART